MKQYNRNAIANATRNTVNAQLFDEQDFALFEKQEQEQQAYNEKVLALSKLSRDELSERLHLCEKFGYDYNVIWSAISLIDYAEEKALQEYYIAHMHDEDHEWFNLYSDWYKDVHGIRPHWVRFE